MSARELENRVAVVRMLDSTDSDPVLSRSARARRPGSGLVHTAVQKPSKLPRAQNNRQKPGSSGPSRPAAKAKSGDCVVITHFPCGGRRVALESLRQCSRDATHRKEVVEQQLDATAPGLHDAGRTLIKAQSEMKVQALEHSDGKDSERGHTSSDSTAVLPPTHDQETQLDAAAENTVTDQLQSSKATEAAAAVETAQIAMEKWHSSQCQQQIRDNQCIRVPQIESGDTPSDHNKEVVSKVNQVLREVRQFQAKMESLVRPFQGVEMKRRPVAPSPLEDAAQVLHQIRRQTKLFNQNLDLVLRAAQTEAFHHRMDAMIRSSSDWTHPTQIRRTVDAWLSLQPEVSTENTIDATAALATVSSQRKAPLRSVMGKSVSTSRQTGRRMVTGNVVRQQANAQKTEVVPSRGRKADSQLKAESYLTRRYGKSPNLSFTPSTLQVIRKNHPRLVENVQGLKLTSTQPHSGDPNDCRHTIHMAVPQDSPIVNSYERWRLLADGAPPTGPSAANIVAVNNRASEHQVNEIKSKESLHLSCSPPLSPLSRMSRPGPVESVRGIKMKSHETQTSLDPPPTVVRPTSSTPAFTPSHVQPHQCTSTHLLSGGDPNDCNRSVYVAVPLGPPMVISCGRWHPPADKVPPSSPSPTSMVAMDDRADEHQLRDTCEALHPPVTSRTVKIMETRSEEDVKYEEDIFPGSDFISIADILQKEDSVVAEDTVEVFGCPSPPLVQYQGPVFPPQAPTALHTNNHCPTVGISLDSNALINLLAEWVEQQVVSQLILEMIPTSLCDPTNVYHTDLSEVEEQSDTSDIEAAGDSDVQQFLDANPSVDRGYFQKILIEVLFKVRASILAEREEPRSSPESEPGLDTEKPRAQEQFQDEVIFTPTPSPPPSPSQHTSRQTMTVVATPPLSESSFRLIESPAHSTSPVFVATPSPSPDPIHSVGSPTTSNSSEVLPPSDKETPEEDLNEHQQAPLTSDVEEQPPPPSPLSPPPSPKPELESPSTSPEESSTSPVASNTSSEESSYSSPSTAVTAGTEAGLKHISEGELVISVNQQAVMTEEEMAACCFSNSLQEFQDMEFDPASEGEVQGQALILSQPVESRWECLQPESSREDQKEGSIGELRDDGVLKFGGPSSRMSPGQISQAADTSEPSSEGINQIQGITSDTTMELMGTLTSDLVTDRSLSPPPDPLPQQRGTNATAKVVMVCSSASHPDAKHEVEEGTASSECFDDAF